MPYDLHTRVYTGPFVTARTGVDKNDQSVLAWLYDQHIKAQENLIDLRPLIEQDDFKNEPETSDYMKRLDDLKRRHTPFFLASAFGKKDNPQTPDSTKRSVRENGGLLRDFIAIDYDIPTQKEADALREAVQTLLKDHAYLLYPSIRYPTEPRYRLVLLIDRLLDQSDYGDYAEALIDHLGVDTHDLAANKTLAHNFNAPIYTHPDAPEQLLYNPEGEPFDLDNLVIKTTKPSGQKKKRISAVPFDEQQLKESLDAFIEDEGNQEKLKDYDYFWRLAESLAYAEMQNLVSIDFINYALHTLAMGNRAWENDNTNVYNAQKNKLETQPDKRDLVRPLAYYLTLKPQSDVKNLAQLFKSYLPSGFEGSTENDVLGACNIISQFFEFALLPGFDTDAEAVAIFDPLQGIWSKNENDLIAMLSIVKPAITRNQVQTAFMYWGAQANEQDKYIQPYSGSQYLVFKNGVLDIVNEQLYDLSSSVVKDQQFTSRHLININYNDDPELVVFEKDSLEGNSWDIDSAINGYAHNDNEIKLYFLFGLSLGLFAGHNTGVHFDIQGESGSGKSTLAGIYRGLFSSQRVAEILFSDLNTDFPITSYDHDTAIIWIKESNTGVSPLDDDRGTPFYDGLADGAARIPVKHQGDIIVDNPPQVYIDGTQLIQSNDIRTGPARRTLAYKLPSPIEPYRDQMYSININERLNDERVLQYLVKQMILAFKTVVPEHRQANFKLNLGTQTDLNLLPDIAKEWRQEFVAADANLRAWFEEDIQESLNIDIADGWVTDEFFHRLYLKWYRTKNPQDPGARFARQLRNFTDILHQIFEEEGYYLLEFRDSTMRNRKRVSSPNVWGFTWSVYDEYNMRPEEMSSANNWPEVYTKKIGGLYRILSEKPTGRHYEAKSELIYVPTIPTNQLDD